MPESAKRAERGLPVFLLAAALIGTAASQAVADFSS